jgi:TolB-like protein
MKRFTFLYIFAIATLLHGPPSRAAEPNKEDVEKAKSGSLTIAVLDFQSNTKGDAELGKQVSEAASAILSGQDGFTMVDRTSMDHILAENALNLTGLVDAARATKVGKLVGAQIMVTGKVFVVDNQIFIAARLTSTETSVYEGVLVTDNQNGNLGALIMKAANEMAAKLKKAGPKLVPRPEILDDPIPGLKKALAGRKLPIIAVQIHERHLNPVPAARIDPAVQTEIEAVLKEAGFTVIAGGEKEWAEAGVTVVITGDAFSEFAARIATLISCTGRVEISVNNRKTSEALYVDRETTRGVDLSENIAAKSALQKAGRVVAIRILQHFVDTPDDGKAAHDDHPNKKKPKADE